MKRETSFLKVAVFLIGIPILALCIFLGPAIANFAAELFPDKAYIKYLILSDLYATAIPFYFALYQAYKLLSYIDKNKAFSELSVKALKYIKHSAITFSGLYVVGMPLFYLVAEVDDAPGFIIIGSVMIFASLVVAIFAAVLQKLLNNAIEMKAESDLTI